jgi:hypothetical protein
MVSGNALKNCPQKREERIGCSSQKAISLARYTVTAEAVAPGQGCRKREKEGYLCARGGGAMVG